MDILKSFVIDVRIIGDDYRDTNFTGKDYCEQKGIEIYYNKEITVFQHCTEKAVYEQELKSRKLINNYEISKTPLKDCYIIEPTIFRR